jgi:hypothetical protein
MGLTDRMMAAPDVVTPSEGIILGAEVGWYGMEADRWTGCFYCINDNGSRRRGATQMAEPAVGQSLDSV